MPRDSSVVPIMQVDAIIEALREHLQGTYRHALHCPRAARLLELLPSVA